ncbi:hypothetical protein RN001_000120 [Aquatica leii]|uniref:Uncharacterized protein n=1 Tax=Aquatica leii TaxID=1421715 RepID=A0AAN7Q2M9_9COLE|nr:hypothetical protein RN001_000120 [Aquatica leii]
MRPPSYLADLPIPTPPPMANLFMTSRFDLPPRGGYSFRRLLNSNSTSNFEASHMLHFGETLYNRSNKSYGGTPILPRKNVYSTEYITEKEKRSKFFSTSSDLSKELEEVQNLSEGLQKHFGSCKDIDEVDCGGVLDHRSSQQIYCNDHYISDIDENEEVKQFCYSYDVSEQKYFSENEKCAYSSRTLPLAPSVKFSRSSKVISPQSAYGFRDSLSPLKSSDFSGGSPLFGRVCDNSYTEKIVKTPMRPVVKIAKIRDNFLNMKTVVFLTLLAASCVSSTWVLPSNITDSWLTLANPFFSECVCKTGVKPDLALRLFTNTDLVNDACLKCFIRCLGVNLNLINAATGLIDEALVVSKAAGVTSDIIAHCNGIAGNATNDTCELDHLLMSTEEVDKVTNIPKSVEFSPHQSKVTEVPDEQPIIKVQFPNNITRGPGRPRLLRTGSRGRPRKLFQSRSSVSQNTEETQIDEVERDVDDDVFVNVAEVIPSNITDAWLALVNPFFSECICQTGVKPDVALRAFTHTDLVDDACLKCFLKCLGIKLNIINLATGAVDENMLASKIVGVTPAIASYCNDLSKNQTDSCQRTYEGVVCLAFAVANALGL